MQTQQSNPAQQIDNDLQQLTKAVNRIGNLLTPPVAQIVTGSRVSGAALQSLLTALANAGIIVDSTTPEPMYVGREFPPFQDQAARLLGINLAELLAVGETITAVTSHLRTLKGPDALPASHLPVAPQFSSTSVHQLVVLDDPAGLLIGNQYALSFLATTSAGQVLGPWARFHVEPGFGVTGYPTGATPSNAQSVILTAAPLFYTLPTLMGGYVGQDLPPANQSEKLAYGFDFSPALSPDETIASATAQLALLDGTDAAVTASPTAYSSGSPVIDGNTVTQLLQWPGGSSLSGNIYALYLTAVTSFNQSLAAWSRIVVDRVA